MKKLLKEYDRFKEHEDEEFKYLKYPNVFKYEYVISNYGQIFSFVSMKRKKYCLDKDGYHRTTIKMEDPNGRKYSRNVGVHRLVAYTFCEKPEGCDIVNHFRWNKG